MEFQSWAVVQGLWGYYERQQERPPAVTPDDPRTEEDKRVAMQMRMLYDYTLARAYDALLNAMAKREHKRLLVQFRAKGDSPPEVHQAWSMIKATHELVTESISLRVSQELSSLLLGQGESIADYWARAQLIKDRCIEYGVPMTTRSFLGQVLNGLPGRWAPLVMIKGEQLAAGALTEQGLYISLLEEEDRRRRIKSQEKKGTGEALYSGHGGRRSPSPNRNRSPQRTAGVKGGSFKRDPNFQPKGLGKDGAWGELGGCPKGYCEGCHKFGHLWRDCYKRPGDQVPKHLHHIIGATEPRKSGSGQDKGKTKWPGKGHGSGGAGPSGSGAEANSASAGGAYMVGSTSVKGFRFGGEPNSGEDADAAKVTADMHLEDGAELGSGWLMDSGASKNFTPHLSDFESDLLEADIKKVRVADGVTLPVCGVGEVIVLGVDNKPITITGVHWVPDMKCRLLSVSHLTRKGAQVLFDEYRCRVFGRTGDLDMEGDLLEHTEHEGLYKLSLPLA
ncbi:MAG: hypothetical protein EBX37_10275, partial [Alphaproteobacteria bacterium]|nr:hypothetical protein [Alphaproteobacteria bacterium]